MVVVVVVVVVGIYRWVGGSRRELTGGGILVMNPFQAVAMLCVTQPVTRAFQRPLI